MHTMRLQAASFQDLRPFKGIGPGFPVYPDLVDDLIHGAPGYDERAAHVCAVLSGWAYSDPRMVATMMVRMGLEHNRCRYINVVNESMFVCSSAFLIQSACGRVALLAYRGTEPLNLVNWLTYADVKPVTVPVPQEDASRQEDASSPRARIHGGFYRNQRATWFDVEQGLALALEGKSILAGTPEQDSEESRQGVRPLEALYITGHSLGAAMAAMAGFRIVHDDSYAAIRRKVRGIYTFGQPMLGNTALAELCEKHELLSERLYRHVFGDDIVPTLPPLIAGDFQHFGRQYESHRVENQHSAKAFEWRPSARSATQLANVVGIGPAVSAMAIEQIPVLRSLYALARYVPFARSTGLAYSLYDHSTTRYILCSQPRGVPSEFGDF